MGFGNLGVNEAVEQSKNLIKSGVNEKKVLGSTKQTTKDGAKKSNKNFVEEKYFAYPADSKESVHRDSLLIKCIQYQPPKAGSDDAIKYEKGQKAQEAVYSKQGGFLGIGGKQVLEKEAVKATKDKWNIGTDASDRFNRDAGTSKQQIQYYIELPIPQQINDSNSVTWGENSMNLFQLAGLTGAKQLIENPKEAVANIVSVGKNILGGEGGTNELGLNADVANALSASVAGKAVNAMGANISSRSVISRATGQILNSNKELLFEGVNIRQFPFNITFTPRSKNDVNAVREIIRKLKRSMAPKRGSTTVASASGGWLIQAPDAFILEYRRGRDIHPFLNKFKPTVLTSMSVNYTGAGTYASYADGNPVSLQMSLVFKELNPIYAEDYDKVKGGVGY